MAVVLCSCATPHYASDRMGAAEHDALVRVFHAQRERAWPLFRLGGGLNVVVENSHLPRAFAWRFPTGGISSSPTVMGTTLLVSANDHHVYAINAATGTLRWKYHAENEVMSQPSYEDGLVYVGIGNAANVVYNPPSFSVIGEGMNKLEAIDAHDGIEQWWAGLDGSGMPSNAIVGSELIDVDGQGTVLAVNARTGRYLWHTTLPTVFAMSCVVDGGDGSIYLSGRAMNAVFALRAADGSLIWKRTFDRYYGGIGDDPLALSGNALVGDYLKATAPGRFGMTVTLGSKARQYAYALDRRDGHVRWRTLLPGVSGSVPPYNESAIELIYGNRVFIGSAIAPIVTALDLRSGKVLWQRRVDGAVKGGIAARDGTLYFGDLAGRIWAVEASSGHVVGSVATDMRFNTGSPIIVNDSFVQGGAEGVIALPLENIRHSSPMPGVTQLSIWQRFLWAVNRALPLRDPHREASYYR